MVSLGVIVAALLAVVPVSAFARGGGSHSWSASGSSHRSGGSHHASSTHAAGAHAASSHHKASGVQRDSHGKIKRDPEQRARFMRSHPCPSTGKTRGACPGYVVDHVRPLKEGGRDDPSNMQWQTVRDAKAKDKWE